MRQFLWGGYQLALSQLKVREHPNQDASKQKEGRRNSLMHITKVWGRSPASGSVGSRYSKNIV